MKQNVQKLILEVEIFLCIVVANVLNHLVYALFLIAIERNKTSFDIVAEEVTESAAEVFMTRVGEERA